MGARSRMFVRVCVCVLCVCVCVVFVCVCLKLGGFSDWGTRLGEVWA